VPGLAIAVLVPIAGAAPPKSGIAGRATLSPTCPVETYPPDPKCAPRGFQAVIRVVRRADGKTMRKAQTDRNGRFRIRLGAARYRVSARPAGGGQLPRCPTRAVTVKKNEFASLTFRCDSGIR
jgi:hypothetical protein